MPTTTSRDIQGKGLWSTRFNRHQECDPMSDRVREEEEEMRVGLKGESSSSYGSEWEGAEVAGFEEDAGRRASQDDGDARDPDGILLRAGEGDESG